MVTLKETWKNYKLIYGIKEQAFCMNFRLLTSVDGYLNQYVGDKSYHEFDVSYVSETPLHFENKDGSV